MHITEDIRQNEREVYELCKSIASSLEEMRLMEYSTHCQRVAYLLKNGVRFINVDAIDALMYEELYKEQAALDTYYINNKKKRKKKK